jgi:hypothetical protein
MTRIDRTCLSFVILAGILVGLTTGCGSVPLQPRDGAGADDRGDGGLEAGSGGAIDAAPDGGASRDGARDAPTEGRLDAACQPEQCNGRDDDCDGVIDNGCPLDLRLLTTRIVAATSAVYGSVTEVGGVPFTDSCPDGQVIVGFTGNAGSALDAVGVSCGTLTVREDRSTTPYVYTVAVATGMQYAPLGGTGGDQHGIDNVLLCGVDEIVAAVETWREPAGTCATNGCAAATGTALGCPTLYGMTVSCAKLVIRGAPGSYTLAFAAPPVASTRAGSGGRADAAAVGDTFSCAPAGVVRSVSGSYGGWPANCAIKVVNGLQLTCTNPVIPLR